MPLKLINIFRTKTKTFTVGIEHTKLEPVTLSIFNDIFTLSADNKQSRPATSAKTTPTKSNNCSTNNSRTNSRDNLTDDNVSQSSVGGGIKGKLAALFSKEQTISESTIANKFKQEREKEMEMLQNRFHYKVRIVMNVSCA